MSSSLGAIWEQMVADAGCATPRALPTGGCSLFPNTDVTQHISQRILGGPNKARPLVWVALRHSWGLGALSLNPCEIFHPVEGRIGPSELSALCIGERGCSLGYGGVPELGKKGNGRLPEEGVSRMEGTGDNGDEQ